MTIEHTESGYPCSCDIAEVTEREAQFLELMDNWYGDKSYRCHSEWLEILTAVTATEISLGPDDLSAAIDAKIAEVAEKAWNEGFGACSQRLMDVSKRLTVLELLCSGAANRGQDEKFQTRWAWYKDLPMVDAFKGSGIDKAVLIAILEDNEPEWTAGDDESVGWHAATRFIRENF